MNPVFLDICRLFIGKVQEPVAHEICARPVAVVSLSNLPP
jgi:hypothetical protein